MPDNVDRGGSPCRWNRASGCSEFRVAAREARLFSWKRALKLLACVLSALWLLLHYVVVPLEGGFRAPLRVLVRNSVIDFAAMWTIFLCVPHRWRYFLGAIFLLLGIAIVWNLWGLRSLPWDRLPEVPN